MKNILLSWIGETDLDASKSLESRKSKRDIGEGPLGQTLKELSFDKVYLIENYTTRKDEVSTFLQWLKKLTKKREIERITIDSLDNPTDYQKIYQVCNKVIDDVLTKEGSSTKLTFHLSPGTSQMHTIWIILAHTKVKADLIQSSQQSGVKQVTIPFRLSANLIPELMRKPDEDLERFTAGTTTGDESFNNIIHNSAAMKKIIQLAERAAISRFPILIEGESGTGKELFASAIHHASPRTGEFIPVNCGAIPEELIEAELFGYKKGAFTGASGNHIGYFEQANGGTIFLDEIGELPLKSQVKLLRVLQEKKVRPLGETKEREIDVRIISATNRNLAQEVKKGTFREDLYFRLAVVELHVPSLRDRDGDIELLINYIFNKVKQESPELGFKHKNFSTDAKIFLLNHKWPGNVRELQSTLVKAAFYSSEDTININDVRNALFKSGTEFAKGILDRPLGKGFNMDALISEVAQHYLSRALKEANGIKTEATKLLGIKNYQTLTNWIKKHKVDSSN